MKPFGVLLFLACLFMVSLLLRLDNIGRGLPQRLPADEATQVESAFGMWNGDLNPHFFRYPTAQIYVLAAVYRVAGLSEPIEEGPSRYLFARIVSAVMGAGTVVLLFLAVRRLLGVVPGVLAGSFLAVQPTHLEFSHYATVDVPMLMWMTGMMVFLVYAGTGREGGETVMRSTGGTADGRARLVTQAAPRWGYLAAAGSALGLSLGTKYSAVFFFPLYVFGVYSAVRQRLPIASETYRRRAGFSVIVIGVLVLAVSATILSAREILLSVAAGFTTDGIVEVEYGHFITRMVIVGMLAAVLIVSLAIAFLRGQGRNPLHAFHHPGVIGIFLLPLFVFVLSSPYVIIDWPHAFRDILYEYRHMAIGSAAHYPAGSEAYESVLGGTAGTPSIQFYTEYLMQHVGIVMLILAAAGLVMAVVRKKWAVLAVIGTATMYAAVIFSWRNQAVRYALPLLPLLAAVAAYVLRVLAAAHPRFRVWVAIPVVLGAIAVPLLGGVSFIQEYRLPDTRMLALHWLQSRTPAGIGLALDDRTLDLEYVSGYPDRIGSSASVLAELPEQALRDCSYRFVVLRDLPSVIAAPPERMGLLRERYVERVRFRPEAGKSTGPALYIFECRQ